MKNEALTPFIEAQTQDEQYRKMASDLRGEDDLGLVIRGHLHIENRLRAFVESIVPEPRFLKRGSYNQTVRLALALGLNDEFERVLFELGNLRNRFAHQIQTKLDKQEADRFAATLGPKVVGAVEGAFQKLLEVAPFDKHDIRELSPKDRLSLYLVGVHQGLIVEVAAAMAGYRKRRTPNQID